jgi:general secretion pathway protein G
MRVAAGESRCSPPKGAPLRRGFTLIEILITLLIILILASFLLGAVVLVQRAVTRARQTAEIQQIDVALNKFKEFFGIFPPSRIRLCEYDSLSNPGSPQGRAYNLDDPFDAHSVAYLKRVWPNLKLWIVQGGREVERPDPQTQIRWFVDSASGAAWDPATVYELEGDECLVFFLGGVAERIAPDRYILHGFTADPKNPSRIMNIALDPRTQTRDDRFPLFPFEAGRLYQRVGDQIAPAGAAENVLVATVPDFFPANNSQPRPPKLPSYRALTSDPTNPKPVVYFSAYEGRGYRPDDCNIPPSLGAPPAEQTIAFQLRWPLLTQPPNSPMGNTIPPSPVSLGPNPYNQAPLSSAVKQVSGQPAGLSAVQPFNPQTFQIIVPGPDNEFGGGGHPDDYDLTQGQRWQLNDDNITNFSGGQAMSDFLGSRN